MAHRRFGSVPTVLDTIDHLVLLDLLGSTFSRIYSYYRETDWLFAEMEGADRRLREAGLVEVERRADEWFGSAKMHNGMIGDDHVPVSVDAFREDESALSRFQFLERGVSVLHVISNPFPQVWHTLAVSVKGKAMFSQITDCMPVRMTDLPFPCPLYSDGTEFYAFSPRSISALLPPSRRLASEIRHQRLDAQNMNWCVLTCIVNVLPSPATDMHSTVAGIELKYSLHHR